MALNRWPLHRLLAWLGALALFVMSVPAGLYLTHVVTSAAERSLSERGESLATTLAGQIVEPLLVQDPLTLHGILKRAVAAEPKARYLCVENAEGQVVAHTFGDGYPASFPDLWRTSRGQVVR